MLCFDTGSPKKSSAAVIKTGPDWEMPPELDVYVF